MKLATLCYLQKDNKTLMLHRVKKKNDYHEGKWSTLGGKFEAGETPEECAKREVFEESGLKVEKLVMKGFITFPMFDGIEDWYVFVFTVPEFSGKITRSPEGNLEWIDNSKLHELSMWEGDKIFIDWLFQDKIFSASFIYENGVYKSYEATFY